ncbi:MAG: DNA internalization-related competence protein ComEC/Rec2 [Acidaminococcaceae bacterium]|jgi:competence protein ComEC|nr:DNA internalization-related competence protein ComEC/Rec2 [Acidaminococcaceae bacterium]
MSAGLALLLLCYSGGILVAAESGVLFSWWQGLVLVLAVATAGICWRVQRLALAVAALAVVAGSSGLLLGAAAWHQGDGVRSLQGRTVVLTGTVDGTTVQQRPDGIALELMDLELQNQAAAAPLTGRVKVFLKQAREDWPGAVYTGRFRVAGEVRPLTGFANPGVRDSERAGRIHGLGGRLTVGLGQVQKVAGGGSLVSHFQRAVSYLRSTALKLLPPREGALLLSMTLGGYNGLDEKVAAIFRENGLAHLLAVSGTHVAFLTALILAVTASWSPVRQKSFIAVMDVLYAAACGFAPAVVRAVACSLVLLAGRTSNRRAHRGRLLAGVALGILACRPLWLLDVSFQLSFGTVAGLIWLLPELQRYLPPQLPAVLREAVAVTLTAQLVSLPLVLWYFHQFSLVALVSNVLLLPALALALLCFVPGLLLAVSLPFLAQLCFAPALFLVRGALATGQVLALLPGAVQTCGHWGYLRTLAYYLALAGWLTPGWCCRLSSSGQRQLLVVSLAVFVGLGCWQAWQPVPLTLYHLDVGQGDAALLATPDRRYFLIDAGGLNGDFDVGARVVVPALRYLGVTELEGLFLSHGDHDHAGGAAAVAEALPIRQVFRGTAAASEDEQKLLRVLRPGTKVRQLTAGQNLSLGATTVEVITAGAGALTPNESSLILRFTCGGQQLLFTGDATGAEELAATGTDIHAQLLKVSHHGAGTASETGFLQRVAPQLAVISAGRGNIYGHPAPEAVARLRQSGALVLRTDILGAIKVVFDGRALRWYSYRYQPAFF